MSQLSIDKIDVVTTAIKRPELLAITYSSFFSRVKNLPKPRIILNIDPLGNGLASECISIAKQYSDDVIVRTPLEPNFASAINWCWSQLQTPYFIHLEDDWFLRRSVDFNVWVQHIQSDRLDQSVLLMKRPRDVDDLRYSFRPHLALSNSVKSIDLIPGEMNPEKYVSSRNPKLSSADLLEYGDHLVVDMGRKWAKAQGLKKTDTSGQWFTLRKANVVFIWEYRLHQYFWRLQNWSSRILLFFQ